MDTGELLLEFCRTPVAASSLVVVGTLGGVLLTQWHQRKQNSEQRTERLEDKLREVVLAVAEQDATWSTLATDFVDGIRNDPKPSTGSTQSLYGPFHEGGRELERRLTAVKLVTQDPDLVECVDLVEAWRVEAHERAFAYHPYKDSAVEAAEQVTEAMEGVTKQVAELVTLTVGQTAKHGAVKAKKTLPTQTPPTEPDPDGAFVVGTRSDS
ncbi:hypothetical protein [Rhodococcus sp. JS3073]|uniref:hypothetical protein n=1 Tax=Rhodococcus sp. JS3073 TaxID=3002901 RepID=UPI0022865F34|nr:hypothetical protein [Rhodococcus sp. JS3073]WAM17508.1 hypothetical protein OYT95_13085 [Rhodococcus sp. JS3073]